MNLEQEKIKQFIKGIKPGSLVCFERPSDRFDRFVNYIFLIDSSRKCFVKYNIINPEPLLFLRSNFRQTFKTQIDLYFLWGESRIYFDCDFQLLEQVVGLRVLRTGETTKDLRGLNWSLNLNQNWRDPHR